MIPNIHQSINEIIESASPEQRVLWQQIRLLVGQNSAVRQLFFQGAIAGSEFLTYSSNKLYLALDLHVSYITGHSATVNGGKLDIYNEQNNMFLYESNVIPAWNSTTAAMNYISSPFNVKNIYFSRINPTQYTHMRFVGYKLTM